jgi:UPF0755 protein
MKRLLVLLLYVALVVLFLAVAGMWKSLFRPVDIEGGERVELLIEPGTGYDDIKVMLDSAGLMVNENAFDLLAKRKRYRNNIKPGYYVLNSSMSNNQILNMLKAGNQTPVKVTFNNIRTLPELAGRLAAQLEPDSAAILSYLMNEDNYRNDGFSRETVIAIFIPDTYEMYWTSTPAEITARMVKEFNAYWNEARRRKAAEHGLEPVEVSILASIIDEEVNKADEKPRIAGVYINRLERGMLLQADPTIRFAINDFTIRRVLNEHLAVDSPYNTYKNLGLPPGPVRCPSKEGIEAVLNAEDHDFLFFVAREDFSGYHHFSRTLREHNNYANRYRQELNRLRVYN